MIPWSLPPPLLLGVEVSWKALRSGCRAWSASAGLLSYNPGVLFYPHVGPKHTNNIQYVMYQMHTVFLNNNFLTQTWTIFWLFWLSFMTIACLFLNYDLTLLGFSSVLHCICLILF